MKIQTMSIVCGTTACNSMCPYCVSRTTPSAKLTTEVNWKNLDIACRLAERGGATTCLITGKGEPTLYPDLILSYLSRIKKYFPLIELQTNVIKIGDGSLDRIVPSHDLIQGVSYLGQWRQSGLTTIAISAVSHIREQNQTIYGLNYPELAPVCDKLHKLGYSIRLSIIMTKGRIDNVETMLKLVEETKKMGIEQLTIRSVHAPENGSGKEVEWIRENQVSVDSIRDFLETYASPVLHLPHGATVYDFGGQNICLTNCLTTNETSENIRQVIFTPGGGIFYDWKYAGARLL